MATLDMTLTISQLMEVHNSYGSILQKFRIDPRFTSQLTLTEVCAMHGLNLQDVANQLETCDREMRFLADEVLQSYDIPQLIGYILFTHHAYLEKELPRLSTLLGEAIETDGASHPQLLELLTPFKDFKESLVWHMREEEKNLFPFFLLLVAPQQSPAMDLESVENLTQLFKTEEGEIQMDLERLKEKTRGYHLPEGVGQATRSLYYDLSRMEFELRRHIHVENKILFPKVIAREMELIGNPTGAFSTQGG